MAELADAVVSKTIVATRAGSSPASATIDNKNPLSAGFFMHATKETVDMVRQWIDEHFDEMLSDLSVLIAINSVVDKKNSSEGMPYGPGPRKALDLVLSMAQSYGLEVHNCAGYIGYADLKGASAKHIGIIGHVDIVEAGYGWDFDPFALSRFQDYLVGRGVKDDKGPLVAALYAVRFWKEKCIEASKYLPCTIRVIFGSAEETGMEDIDYYKAKFEDPYFLFTPDSQYPLGCKESGICNGTLTYNIGTKRFIKTIQGGTSLNAVPAFARALVDFDSSALLEEEGIAITKDVDGLTLIEAKGRASHAMAPFEGDNAILRLLRYLYKSNIGTDDERMFLNLAIELTSDYRGVPCGVATSDEHFGDLFMTGSMIDTNEEGFSLSFDFRYPTSTTSKLIEEQLNAYLFQEIRDLSIASFSMNVNLDPYIIDPDSLEVLALLQAYRDVTGDDHPVRSSRGGTYARRFSKGVSFGAEKSWIVDPEWAGGMHEPNEAIRESDLKEAVEVYIRALGNLMKIAY